MFRSLAWALLLFCSYFATSCNLESISGAEFKHANDKAFDAATLAFDADEVSLSTERANSNDSIRTYLNLFLLNPKQQPTQPDTLAKKLKYLARLLVVDLKNPQDFDAVRIRMQTDHDYGIASTTNAQTYEFPLAELQ